MSEVKNTPSQTEIWQSELGKITSELLMIGHRGMNQADDPREMAAARRYENYVSGQIDRANEIAFLMETAERGVNPQDYLLVGQLDTRKMTESAIGYSASDVHSKAYGVGLSKIMPSDNMVNVYRKPEAVAMPRSQIWNEELSWWKIARYDGYPPQTMADPAQYLRKHRDFNFKRGAKAEKYEHALAEVEAGKVLPKPPKLQAIEVKVAQPVPEQSFRPEISSTENGTPLNGDLADYVTLCLSFGRLPKTYEQLLEHLIYIRGSQLSLKRDVSKYERAIQTIETRIVEIKK